MGSMKLPPTPFFPEMSTQLFVGGRGAGGRAASQPQGLRVSTKGILCPGDRWTDRHIHRNRELKQQRETEQDGQKQGERESERQRDGDSETYRDGPRDGDRDRVK